MINVTTGLTAVALATAGGPFTVGGVTYGYRSASITATTPLGAGAKSFTVTATDVASNTGNLSGSVTVDNTVPAAADVQTANKVGGTIGKAEAGDTITYTFSEAMDPNSILSGWTGASTPVTLHLNDGGAGSDTVTIFDSTNATQLPLGSVNLARTDYVTANATFTGSTMVMSGSTITITLGTASGATTTVGNADNMVWSPATFATDLAGNACNPATASETGAANKEF